MMSQAGVADIEKQPGEIEPEKPDAPQGVALQSVVEPTIADVLKELRANGNQINSLTRQVRTIEKRGGQVDPDLQAAIGTLFTSQRALEKMVTEQRLSTMTDEERADFQSKRAEEAEKKANASTSARSLSQDQMRAIVDEEWPDQLDEYRVESERLGIPWSSDLEKQLEEPKDDKGNVISVIVDRRTGKTEWRAHRLAVLKQLAAVQTALKKSPAEEAGASLGDGTRATGQVKATKPDFVTGDMDELYAYAQLQEKQRGAKRGV